MNFLTSAKQLSEFEVLFIQFLTIADATTIKVNGKDTKLSKIEDIFEIGEDGNLRKKDGVEFNNKQENIFKGRYQAMSRKLAGAYRQTEISNAETHWAGKSGMFLRRYFVPMVSNRFQGDRWSSQERDAQMGYQKEVFNNLIRLFKIYSFNVPKYWRQLSDKEKASHFKMLKEYGILMIMLGLYSLGGGNDNKKELKKNSYWHNLYLVGLLRAKSELEQFTLKGIDDLIRTGKNPFMMFTTIGNITKLVPLTYQTIFRDESAFYKQSNDTYVPILGKIHEKGDSKLLVNFLKLFGITGATFTPHEYIINFRNAQNR